MRINLELPNIGDRDEVLRWRNSERIREYMFQDEEIDTNTHISWWETANSKDSFLRIGKHLNISLGVIRFVWSCRRSSLGSWAFYINPFLRRSQGVGVLLEYSALEFIFRELNCRKLTCEVLDGNKQVISMHKKFGFIEEGHFFKERVKLDGLHDVTRLAMFKEIWEMKREDMKERVDRIYNLNYGRVTIEDETQN